MNSVSTYNKITLSFTSLTYEPSYEKNQEVACMPCKTGPEVIKLFMLNSEHEIYPAHKFMLKCQQF